MKKKILPLFALMLMFLIGNANAATLTQKIGNSSVSQSVNQGQQVTLKFVNKPNYTFSSWTVESGGVTLDTTSSSTVTFTMPNTNVVIKANYEEEVVGVNLASVATVGAYVTYVPNSTSYTVPKGVSGHTSDQFINPSSTTSWRVFSNDGTNVEIISAEGAGTVSLSGGTGYVNLVQTLNDASASYVNPIYAISGRSLGYNEDGLATTQIANYKVIDTELYPLKTSAAETFPYNNEQDNMLGDIISSSLNITNTDDTVWVASRYSDDGSGGNYSAFYGGSCMQSWASYFLKSNMYSYIISSKRWVEDSRDHKVRPIITLKSNLTVTGGSGTAADPYIINTTNPSQYTVTYSANGGYGEMMPQSVAQGNSVTLRANTYEHHSKSFLGWSTTATAATATYTDGQSITPTADMTLYAVWQKATHEIVVSAGVGGTITPGTTEVASGGNQTFTVTANNGYEISSLKVDGSNVNVARTSNFTTDGFFTVTGSGSYPWSTPNGTSFLSSNQGEDSTTSTSTITFSGTGILSFNYAVSSESGYDKLTIRVTDSSGTTTVTEDASGEKTGKYTASVSGDITISLSYSKDSGSYNGDDCAWISDLTFRPTIYPYTFTNVTSSHALDARFQIAYMENWENDNSEEEEEEDTNTYGTCIGCQVYREICNSCGYCQTCLRVTFYGTYYGSYCSPCYEVGVEVSCRCYDCQGTANINTQGLCSSCCNSFWGCGHCDNCCDGCDGGIYDDTSNCTCGGCENSAEGWFCSECEPCPECEYVCVIHHRHCDSCNVCTVCSSSICTVGVKCPFCSGAYGNSGFCADCGKCSSCTGGSWYSLSGSGDLYCIDCKPW